MNIFCLYLHLEQWTCSIYWDWGVPDRKSCQVRGDSFLRSYAVTQLRSCIRCFCAVTFEGRNSLYYYIYYNIYNNIVNYPLENDARALLASLVEELR